MSLLLIGALNVLFEVWGGAGILNAFVAMMGEISRKMFVQMNICILRCDTYIFVLWRCCNVPAVRMYVVVFRLLPTQNLQTKNGILLSYYCLHIKCSRVTCTHIYVVACISRLSHGI